MEKLFPGFAVIDTTGTVGPDALGSAGHRELIHLCPPSPYELNSCSDTRSEAYVQMWKPR
ncbi:hypothetical protein EYF80_026591 [Liparis tanakae]|uniref:Uncharacterized protein n=1 Tax=Liparis tanakae TaxID=230148 RepID=A0A4Z2HB49_9TELE|nr:hypothetical protein EYF80_026591 [Liparis tanakae]